MSRQKQKTETLDRRRFLGKAATLAAGITLAPGVMLYGIGDARGATKVVSADVRWGLLIDVNKCSAGCDACVSACQTENGVDGHGRPKTDAKWIRKVDLRNPKTGQEKSLPLMCQHCAEPPCVDVCPTGASFKRADGIVLVDKHICIGCRYCMMACPYKARSFIHEPVDNQKPYAPRGKGTVESCTLCVHRVDAGRVPACVEACADAGHGTILFGDLKDPESAISRALNAYPARQIRADLGVDPGVWYRSL